MPWPAQPIYSIPPPRLASYSTYRQGRSPHASRVPGLRAALAGLFHLPHARCALTSSLACLDQARLHTCEPVSMHCSGWPVKVFQNRMQRSAVPPPDASSPCWCGDQAIAFTAARCSVYCCTGLRLEWFHTSSCRTGQGCDRAPPRDQRHRAGTNQGHVHTSRPALGTRSSR